MSVTTLQRLESRELRIRLDVIAELSNRLDVPMEYLFADVRNNHSGEIEKSIHLCRELVYDNDYDALEITLKKLSQYLHSIGKIPCRVSTFLDWHRAILIHKKEGNPYEAEHLLRNLLPYSLLPVTELEIGIANSLALILIETGRLEKAENLLMNASQALEALPIIEDRTLYPRIMYNLLLIKYHKAEYDQLLQLGLQLLYYLAKYRLYYLAGELHHLLSLTFEKQDNLEKAIQHMQQAVYFFRAQNREYLYAKALRALADVQLKTGEREEGIRMLQKAEIEASKLKEGNDLIEKIQETKRKYLL